MPGPRLLILDEPTNGLDPEGIREVRLLLRAIADTGLTILVSSHRLDEIQTVCDHLVIMDGGRIGFQGAITELLTAQAPEVIAIPESRRAIARASPTSPGRRDTRCGSSEIACASPHRRMPGR